MERCAPGHARALLALPLLLGFALPLHAQFVEPGVRVLHTLNGDGAGEFFGYVANAVPDLDHDGVPDLLCGAPTYSVGATNRGRAYLMSGRTGARIHVFDGAMANALLGSAVNHAGDLNGDGVADLLLGAPASAAASPNNGQVFACSGADFSLLWSASGEAANDRFGNVVAGLLDDVDHDGFDDVIVGAVQNDAAGANAGRAYLLSGKDGSILRIFTGRKAGDFFGSAVAGTGDLDGDGVADVVVSARNAGSASEGRTYVLSSATGNIIRELAPDPTGVDFGWFFTSTAGDVDRDGTEDLYVPDFSDRALGAATGRAYVFSGAGPKLRDWQGEAAGSGFGIGRGGIDMDRDGADDLFLAAWTSSSGAPSAGKGYVLSGTDGSVLQTMTCTLAGAQLGYDALILGDVNDDGAVDVVLTGRGHDPASINRGDGAAFVISGPVLRAERGVRRTH